MNVWEWKSKYSTFQYLRMIIVYSWLLIVIWIIYTKGYKRHNARIEIASHNKRLETKTLTNSIKEIKRIEVHPLEHLLHNSVQNFRIESSQLAPGQCIASIYAKGSTNAPWVFVRDHVLRLFNSTGPIIEFSKKSKEERLSIIQERLSSEIYAKQVYGYPIIMKELVEALPVLKGVPARSLVLGFQIHSSVMQNTEEDIAKSSDDAKYPIYRIQRSVVRQKKVMKIASALTKQDSNILLAGHVPLLNNLLQKSLTNLATTISSKSSILHDKTVVPHWEIYLSQIILKQLEHRIGSELVAIEITSDGSLLTIPIPVSSNPTSAQYQQEPFPSSSNTSIMESLHLGAGGIFLRLSFTNMSSTEARKVVDREAISTGISLSDERVISQLSRRAKQQKTTQSLHKLKVKALVHAQKELKKNSLQPWEVLYSSPPVTAEETMHFSINPFYSLNVPTIATTNEETAMITSFDTELAAGVFAITLVNRIVSILHVHSKNKNAMCPPIPEQQQDNSYMPSAKQIPNLKVTVQSDSKPLIRLIRTYFSPSSIENSQELMKENGRFRTTTDYFRHQLKSQLYILQQKQNDVSLSFHSQWIASHPEKRILYSQDWTAEDWSVWQADWLSQYSFSPLHSANITLPSSSSQDPIHSPDIDETDAILDTQDPISASVHHYSPVTSQSEDIVKLNKQNQEKHLQLLRNHRSIVQQKAILVDIADYL